MIPSNAAAILDQLEQKDAPVFNLLALCRTHPYLSVWEKGRSCYGVSLAYCLSKGIRRLALKLLPEV